MRLHDEQEPRLLPALVEHVVRVAGAAGELRDLQPASGLLSGVLEAAVEVLLQHAPQGRARRDGDDHQDQRDDADHRDHEPGLQAPRRRERGADRSDAAPSRPGSASASAVGGESVGGAAVTAGP